MCNNDNLIFEYSRRFALFLVISTVLGAGTLMSVLFLGFIPWLFPVVKFSLSFTGIVFVWISISGFTTCFFSYCGAALRRMQNIIDWTNYDIYEEWTELK